MLSFWLSVGRVVAATLRRVAHTDVFGALDTEFMRDEDRFVVIIKTDRGQGRYCSCSRIAAEKEVSLGCLDWLRFDSSGGEAS